MVTRISYRESEFKGAEAMDLAIERAGVDGWSVSEIREVSRGRFVVRFRFDEDACAGSAQARRSLPAFEAKPIERWRQSDAFVASTKRVAKAADPGRWHAFAAAALRVVGRHQKQGVQS